MTDPDAELDALVAQLTEAGLIEEHTDDDGKPYASRRRALSSGGAMAMAGHDADAEAILDALLDGDHHDQAMVRG
jgi:hypothetical protein